jgi:hypothetical protein
LHSSQALAYKQKTLAIPKSKRRLSIQDKVTEWRDQLSEDTEGFYFVTIEDVIAQKSIDINSLKTALQVLRFLGTVKLISTGGVARYSVKRATT